MDRLQQREIRPFLYGRAEARPFPPGRTFLAALSTRSTQFSSALYPITGKERGRTLSRVSSEALEKPCVTHERDMHPVGCILRFAWHTR